MGGQPDGSQGPRERKLREEMSSRWAEGGMAGLLRKEGGVTEMRLAGFRKATPFPRSLGFTQKVRASHRKILSKRVPRSG